MGSVDNTPTGRLILQIMLSFAEFEREMIKERTAAGKAIARQKPGYKEGRPKQITPEIIKQIKKVCPGKNWGSAGRRGTGIRKANDNHGIYFIFSAYMPFF
jgi:DNA invertase Pin-like site-specific DNA recombinase